MLRNFKNKLETFAIDNSQKCVSIKGIIYHGTEKTLCEVFEAIKNSYGILEDSGQTCIVITRIHDIFK